MASGSTPSCLGEACIEKKPLTEVEISEKFGKSFSRSVSKIDNSSTYCFQFESEDGPFYLKIMVGDQSRYNNFSEIKYSSAKICNNDKTTQSKGKLKTIEGISLGSTVEELRKTYGKPSWTVDSPVEAHYSAFFGEKSEFPVDSIICYAAGENDTLHALFFVSKGIVVGIKISTAP